jgi:hypothetical protein
MFDESSKIADKVWEVTEGSLTDANTEILWLVFGNGTRATGRFRECFRKFRHRWDASNIDSRDVEGTNKELFKTWIEDYGEDSDFVKVRVRGMFPSASLKQFIDEADVDKGWGKALTPEQYEFAPSILTSTRMGRRRSARHRQAAGLEVRDSEDVAEERQRHVGREPPRAARGRARRRRRVHRRRLRHWDRDSAGMTLGRTGSSCGSPRGRSTRATEQARGDVGRREDVAQERWLDRQPNPQLRDDLIGPETVARSTARSSSRRRRT